MTGTKTSWTCRSRNLSTALTILGLLGAAPLLAVDPPEPSGLRAKQFWLAELDVETAFVAPSAIPSRAPGQASLDLAGLNVPAGAGRLDARSGRWASITPVRRVPPISRSASPTSPSRARPRALRSPRATATRRPAR